MFEFTKDLFPIRVIVSPAVCAHGGLFPFWSRSGTAQILQGAFVPSLKSIQFSSSTAVSSAGGSGTQKNGIIQPKVFQPREL